MFAKEAVGTNTEEEPGRVCVWGGVGERLLLCRPPLAADLPEISMAAVAGDAENINKQARTVRTNWIKNTQAANGLFLSFLSSAPVGGARAAYLCGRALGPLHPSRTDHVVPTLAVVGSRFAFFFRVSALRDTHH